MDVQETNSPDGTKGDSQETSPTNGAKSGSQEPSPAGEAKAGSSKARSQTQYPFYGLTTVKLIVDAVRAAGGNDAAQASDILRQLGTSVSKTDRLWAYGIPAAILFSVVEREGRGDDARYKLTELGRRLALPGTPEEERATKVAVFKQPDLYAKLLDKFAGCPVPAKDVLKRLLERDFGIVNSMAGNAADAFLESMKVAELITPANMIAPADGGGGPAMSSGKQAPPANTTSPEDDLPGVKSIKVPAEFVIYRCKLSGGRVIEIPLPQKFTRADVGRLHAFLLTQVDDEEVDSP